MSLKALSPLALAAFLLASTLPARAQTTAAPDGAAAFNKGCQGCHAGGMAGLMSGAPKAGSAAMKARLTRAGSVDALVTNTVRGVGKMRAQGGPNGLPDAEIRAAVEWMLANEP